MQQRLVIKQDQMSLGRAVVLGATGQTGSAMVEELLSGTEARVTGVVAYGNSRLLQYEGPRKELLECRQAKMEELVTTRGSELQGFDAIFFHIGTQRAKAGLEGQLKLEFDDTLAVAKIALEGGCKRCHLVSSASANANSMVTYFKTKGRIEDAIQALGFEAVYIYRPASLFGGDRTSGFFKKYVLASIVPSIHVTEVSKAMRITALRGEKGIVVLENKQLLQLAKQD